MIEIEKLDRLLRGLLAERPEYSRIAIPESLDGKRQLLRSLMNVRMPKPLAPELMALQDEELREQREEKGTVTPDEMLRSPLDGRLRLWRGDITRLDVDAIVNAANLKMLGCFVPLHRCIDNAIHSAAGMELREECARLMREQGHDEPTGQAKITPGYNLPARWVIHTVGPIVYGDRPTETDRRLLADCYRNCMALADGKGLKSIAFCCISTGEFHYPQEEAARVAVATVEEYLKEHPESGLEAVVFDVFKESDYEIYRKILNVGMD